MTQDEIIRMAREAGYDPVSETIPSFHSFIERFAALVAAHEREACANTVEEFGTLGDSESRSHAKAFAAAIRARGEKCE